MKGLRVVMKMVRLTLHHSPHLLIVKHYVCWLIVNHSLRLLTIQLNLALAHSRPSNIVT